MKDIEYSKISATQELQNLISNWLNEKKDRRLAKLARYAGVTENCLRRVMNQNSLPTTENLHKILLYLKKAKTNQQLVEQLPETLGDQLKNQLAFIDFAMISNYRQMVDKEHYLKEFSHKVIFERACMNNGITILQVKEMFGLKGEQAALDLIEDGLIQLVENKYIAKSEFVNHTFSPSFYKKYTAELISEFYKTESDANFIYNFSAGVSVIGYNNIINILKSTTREIQNIIDQMPGEIPITSTLTTETMTYSTIFKKTEKK